MAAVPFLEGDASLGVLAVERVRERRLDRVELAHLAVVGEAIAQLLTLGGPDETRFGFALQEQARGGA
jgi:signal transduction protein with GAF and PtsI domain